MSFEKNKFMKNLFLNELKKNIQLQNLLDLYSEYLDNVDDHKVMRYLITNHPKINQTNHTNTTNNYNTIITLTEENINLVMACHSVWKYTQVITNNISLSKRNNKFKLSYEIMITITLYSAVYEIFKSKMSNFAEHLISVYEDVCLMLNSPRKEFEECDRLIKLRTIYYLDIYLPLNILGVEHDISEVDFVLYNLLKSEDKNLLEKLKICSKIKSDHVKILEKIDHNENILIREMMKFVDFCIE